MPLIIPAPDAISEAGQHLLRIDKRRTDAYTANGSDSKPFKTFAAALAQAVANGDGATTPYSFVFAEGSYAEEINLNNIELFDISIIGLGRVAIDPASGNSLTCTTGNNAIKSLTIRNMEFADPVVITGNNTADQFSNVTFYDVALGVLTATCMNSLNVRGAYISGDITLSNVAWFYWDSVQHDSLTASFISDTTATQPSWGMSNSGGYLIGGKFQDLAFTRTGTGNFNLSLNNCYAGLTASNYTVPAGFTVNLRNSTVRGNWTNNGTLNLYASAIKPVLGTAPVYPLDPTYAVNTEYVSPNQHGGLYGIVYRTYFTTALPAALTTGNNVSKLLHYEATFTNGIHRYTATGYTIGGSPATVEIYLAGTTGKNNLSLTTAGGWTVTDGWVDYTK